MLGKLRAFHSNPSRRPYWQIVLLLPLFLLYAPADAFVRWADKAL